MWRKQATISVQDEFTGQDLPPDLEDSLPPTLNDTMETVRNGVRRSSEIYINLCTLMERMAKRNEGLAADHLRFSLALQSLTEVTKDTYTMDHGDVPLLNEGIRSTARHLSTNQSLLEDEARAWGAGVLEDLKQQRDCLVSMRDLFDRRDRYARNNIPQLERRIETNERKLEEFRARPAGTVKLGEIERVEDSIFKVSSVTSPLFFSFSVMPTVNIGQGVDCAPTCARSFHPSMSPGGNGALPSEPVPHYSTTSGLEPGAGEILRVAGGQLAVLERPGGGNARWRIAFIFLCVPCFLLVGLHLGVLAFVMCMYVLSVVAISY